ncbi:hypothetical protein L249_2955 [Ophiocordyceps polyrhachis-furcata BCC 54312]|uniref:Insulin-induced protein n=1 Tax=Ophiocordyceps polyrhachis-furcata BCC 54312 TaxID=1330021 RepID=A0A367LQ81_9HYPO|nr:hypothetical protein L249_2955 [Ophiocordyceps polyrhachis-furcata BCC 54312]
MAEHGPTIQRPIPRRPFRLDFISATPPPEQGDDVNAENGPTILRQIPRRSFSLDFVSATPPPEDDYSPPTDASLQDLAAACVLDPDAESLSRQKSLLNLTSPTLMGIYASGEVDDTPWHTTPVKPRSLDDATYQLMRHRSRPSNSSSWMEKTPTSTTSAFALTARVALLFLLGSGYGVLVTRLHGGERYGAAHLTDGLVKPGLSCNYIACWGAFGVILGSLLPWFDKMWDDTFGGEADVGEPCGENLGPGTDWALVMRAIAAFAGIVFAIRKLSWVSTLQISATLALANPLLWWLIDRSKAGLFLSAGVGLAGSAVLLSVKPDMMPAPCRALPHVLAGRNMPSAVLGGLASRETVETGIWLLSVLFNSCVCFGNVGRRLVWNGKAGIRGRWGGVR